MFDAQGPVGVQTCYCGPVLHRLECRLAKDKQDILQRLDSAHLRLDAKIDGLERKTQQQLQGLQRTVDSLGLESSAAGLQRVRNSIVLADPGHSTPPLPSLDLTSNSTTSHSRFGSSDASVDKRNGKSNNKKTTTTTTTAAVHSENGQQKQPDEVQYTLDKLGLDASSSKQLGLQALRNRLALTRIREQKELDAIVEHYERRNQSGSDHNHSHHLPNGNSSNGGVEESADEESESEDEEEDDEHDHGQLILPPILSSQKATPMASDSR